MKKYNYFAWILLLVLLIGNGIQFYYYKKHPQITVIEKTDTLEAKIDTVYIKIDSLLTDINNSKKDENELEKEYKEVYNDIINQSSDSDFIFFTEYLKKQSARGLFDNNN